MDARIGINILIIIVFGMPRVQVMLLLHSLLPGSAENVSCSMLPPSLPPPALALFVLRLAIWNIRKYVRVIRYFIPV